MVPRRDDNLRGATLKYLVGREGKAEFAAKLRAELMDLSLDPPIGWR